MGFAVGHSKAAMDAWSTNLPTSFDSDFFIGIDPTGTKELKIFKNGGTQDHQQGFTLTGTQNMSVAFTGISDFNSGSTVNYEAFIDGSSIKTGSFTWSGTDENYIGLYSNYTQNQAIMDNFEIRANAVVATFPLTITPAVSGYDLEWVSQDGMLYNVWSTPDLSEALVDWDLVEGDIAASGTGTNTKNVIPAEAVLFYLVEEFPPPPVILLDEDFEAVTAPGPPTDWSFDDNGAGTAWSVGTPTDVGTEPDAAANGTQCAGTNIGGNYTGSAVASIITMAFTVPASGATLSFSQYIDTEIATSGDLGSIRLLNAGDDSALVGGDVATGLEGITEAWSSETLPLPAVANGLSVKLEFRFESDADGDVFAGFYIDDVVVTAP